MDSHDRNVFVPEGLLMELSATTQILKCFLRSQYGHLLHQGSLATSLLQLHGGLLNVVSHWCRKHQHLHIIEAYNVFCEHTCYIKKQGWARMNFLDHLARTSNSNLAFSLWGVSRRDRSEHRMRHPGCGQTLNPPMTTMQFPRSKFEINGIVNL